jgi:hypothetical protein
MGALRNSGSMDFSLHGRFRLTILRRVMIPALAVAVIPALLLPPLLLPFRAPVLFAALPLAPLLWVYIRAIAARKIRTAVTLALAWTAAVTVSTVAAAAHSPDAVPSGIWHATVYRDEMLQWIATGVGAEGNPALFLPRVLAEYALLLVLAACSAGAIGLFMGSILLGYMNGYVGWVVAHADPSASPLAVALFAWPPWAISRVVSFVLAGTAAAAYGYPRIFDRRGPRPRLKPILVASLVFLALDIVLKALLAPTWRLFLRGLLGASAGIDAGGTG